MERDGSRAEKRLKKPNENESSRQKRGHIYIAKDRVLDQERFSAAKEVQRNTVSFTMDVIKETK